jgi:hypothetical protein
MEELVVMADFPMISPLSDADLDAVAGGLRIRQNARGGDSIAWGGNGGDATAAGVGGVATGGAGGLATSAVGGVGGTNTITGPL